MAPIMSTKTVAMSTHSRRIEAALLELGGKLEGACACIIGTSAANTALGRAPEQESRGAPRHQQHPVDGTHSEILELQVGQDLDRDGPGVIRVENDGSYEVPERGDEGQSRAGGERRAQLRQIG